MNANYFTNAQRKALMRQNARHRCTRIAIERLNGFVLKALQTKNGV